MTFHALQRSEFPLLGQWLAEPLVARWWNHDPSAAAIERDFGPSVDGRDATTLFVAEVGGWPFGLIQRYPIAAYPEYLTELSSVCTVPAGALSVDYLIGVPEFRGRGLGSSMITACCNQTWAVCPDAHDIIVAVSVGNRASWRALEHAEFRRIAEGHLKPDNPRDPTDHYIYRRTRPQPTG